MSLTGIINEHEFYSQHYLDEIFPTEIQKYIHDREARETADKKAADAAQAKGIEKQVIRPAWSQLNTIGRTYLQELERLPGNRDRQARLEAERQLTAQLLSIFGLPCDSTQSILLECGFPLHVTGEIRTLNRRPFLWILEASSTGGTPDSPDAIAEEGTDPLEMCISPLQTGDTQGELPATARNFGKGSWFDILSNGVFNEVDAPRWVLLTHPEQWLLIDRAKFAQRRLLRFDWREILSRREDAVLKATSVLIGSDTFAIHDGQCRLEVLDENSFRHAQGVSEDLKYALREAIEILGNEAARQLREQYARGKRKFFSDSELADDITSECLRYMYRLLFLFFVESRPELKYAPVSEDTYLKGYSLESLRDLEMMPLVQEEDRNGRFIHDSIQQLFAFFSQGTDRCRQIKKELGYTDATAEAFEILPLQSTLFDESRIKRLKDVVFPNHILQQVICLMSLSRETGGKGGRRRRGRISYAHLGLNQLGAVYESLLSYRGFFAADDLYEVKPAKNKTVNPLEAAYFVPQDELDRYTDDEKVFVTDPQSKARRLKVYPKGSFIYRMAGRERENSASYYTPEVLTKCVVEEALDVLARQQLDALPDDRAKAAKILSWRICEPAMGSAAFLNEAVNQIAELYMQHATRIPGARVLSQKEYSEERQKVRMFLADRNIYGVDLNPIAVELAEVSLWLNALSSDRFVPWFGLQLECGNSLIGCRRQAYWRRDLEQKNWRNAIPHEVGAEGLQEDEIWHFLVPDAGMNQYRDVDVQQLEPDAIKRLDEWRKNMTRPFQPIELDRMVMISATIDQLWMRWATEMEALDRKTTDTYAIYGYAEEEKSSLSYQQKQELMEKFRTGGDNLMDSGSYARLKLAMDYWCSLWFWPLDKAGLLPTREEWLRQMQAIVSGVLTQVPALPKTDLFEENLFTAVEEKEQALSSPGAWRKAFDTRYPALGVVRDIVSAMRFLHWELRFATVFLPQSGEHSGFDLTLGNPPWKTVTWDSAGILGEADPVYFIHEGEYSAKGIRDVVQGKRDVLEGRSFFDRHPETRAEWLTAYTRTTGMQNFFNAVRNFPECSGSQSDLFKYFLPVVWRNAAPDGTQGLLHPETVYTETKGDTLREATYIRLRRHYQFANENKLFADVDHHVSFSVNIYGRKMDEPDFESINNLYHPVTIKRSRVPSQMPVQGRKDAQGKWNLAGHPDRILKLDRTTLEVIGRIFNTGTTAPLLPNIHASELLGILTKLGYASCRLSDLKPVITAMWHESGAKKDGTMRELPEQRTVFPKGLSDAIINGPVIHVGTPLFKCLDDPCPNNLSATCIDLTAIADDYLPRVKYQPALSIAEYERRIQQVMLETTDSIGQRVIQKVPVYRFYRLALRSMVGTDSERTLTSGVIPPSVAHPHKIESIVFRNVDDLLITSACFAALPLDFFVRQQGKGDLLPSLLNSLPVPPLNTRQQTALKVRVLALNCLTRWYADLWETAFDDTFHAQQWAGNDPHLDHGFFAGLPAIWERRCALRDDLSRRQALLEIDVIVAQAFGLTLEELQTAYRLGFRVMRDYDNDTWYDQTGRIVFTPNSNGLKGVGLPRRGKPDADIRYAIDGESRDRLGFEDIRDMESGTVSKTFTDITLPGNPRRTIVYQAPFFKKDREADYAEAWRYFESCLKED